MHTYKLTTKDGEALTCAAYTFRGAIAQARQKLRCSEKAIMHIVKSPAARANALPWKPSLYQPKHPKHTDDMWSKQVDEGATDLDYIDWVNQRIVNNRREV